jgi:acyl carrier protein
VVFIERKGKRNVADGEIYTRVLNLVRETAASIEEADASRPLVLLGEDGLFDSVTALELVLAIEREFQIVVTDGDVTPENLGSIESMVRFIQKKLARPTHGLASILQPLAYISMLSMVSFAS